MPETQSTQFHLTLTKPREVGVSVTNRKLWALGIEKSRDLFNVLSKLVLEFKTKSVPEKMFLVSEKKNQIIKQ